MTFDHHINSSIENSIDSWLKDQQIFVKKEWIVGCRQKYSSLLPSEFQNQIYREFLYSDLVGITSGSIERTGNFPLVVQVEEALDISHSFYSQINACKDSLTHSARLIVEEEVDGGESASDAKDSKTASKNTFYKYALVDCSGRLFYGVLLNFEGTEPFEIGCKLKLQRFEWEQSDFAVIFNLTVLGGNICQLLGNEREVLTSKISKLELLLQSNNT